jgi:enamidase
VAMTAEASGLPAARGALINIGQLFTGDWRTPELAAEAIHISDGRIDHIGANSDVIARDCSYILDLAGMTVTPGLIDTHVHPLIGDWTSRHRIIDWIEGYGRAGVTTLVSQGSPHLEGRPRDGVGTKLLAMLSARVFKDYRPGGVRVAAGTVLLEPGLGPSDWPEMYDVGVRHVGEIGISGVQDPAEALPMVLAAREAGMRISMHFGAPSVAGSRGMGLAEALVLEPDVLAHANGGSTGRPDAELLEAVQATKSLLEGSFHGGLRQMILLADDLARRGEFHRLVLGSDSPSAVGIVPQAIMRLVTYLCGLSEWSVGHALAAASGNAQRAFGLEAGVVAVGARADLLCLDAPLGSTAVTAAQALTFGDVPGIATVLQDGIPMAGRAVNAPFPKRPITHRAM